MIPKRLTSEMLKGKKAVVLRNIKTNGGHEVSKGTVVTIYSAHYGIHLDVDECIHCGEGFRVAQVPRSNLELVQEEIE